MILLIYCLRWLPLRKLDINLVNRSFYTWTLQRRWREHASRGRVCQGKKCIPFTKSISYVRYYSIFFWIQVYIAPVFTVSRPWCFHATFLSAGMLRHNVSRPTCQHSELSRKPPTTMTQWVRCLIGPPTKRSLFHQHRRKIIWAAIGLNLLVVRHFCQEYELWRKLNHQVRRLVGPPTYQPAIGTLTRHLMTMQTVDNRHVTTSPILTKRSGTHRLLRITHRTFTGAAQQVC